MKCPKCESKDVLLTASVAYEGKISDNNVICNPIPYDETMVDVICDNCDYSYNVKDFSWDHIVTLSSFLAAVVDLVQECKEYEVP